MNYWLKKIEDEKIQELSGKISNGLYSRLLKNGVDYHNVLGKTFKFYEVFTAIKHLDISRETINNICDSHDKMYRRTLKEMGTSKIGILEVKIKSIEDDIYKYFIETKLMLEIKK